MWWCWLTHHCRGSWLARCATMAICSTCASSAMKRLNALRGTLKCARIWCVMRAPTSCAHASTLICILAKESTPTRRVSGYRSGGLVSDLFFFFVFVFLSLSFSLSRLLASVVICAASLSPPFVQDTQHPLRVWYATLRHLPQTAQRCCSFQRPKRECFGARRRLSHTPFSSLSLSTPF
jgi:hypothetical protein